jgi:Predicted N6-adenine-specific DNA methylase
LIARGLPPGAKRRFAFMDWPSFDANRWRSVLGGAERGARPPGAAIRGADRDAGAIAASRRNAERAGVATDIEFSAEALSASMAKLGAMGPGPGWVIANPPYGVRVGDPAGLRNLYASIGTELRANPGWHLGILTSDVSVARHAALPLSVSFNTRNGGIPVSFLVDQQPAKREVRPSPVGVEAER